MIKNYLNSVVKQFEYYKVLGEKTFDQLKGDDYFWCAEDSANTIAIIVNHLWGNMTSRWTDFLKSDGEKDWRERDLEFEPVIKSKEEMLDKWDEGWFVLFAALREIDEGNFGQEIFIRNQSHTIIEAINRQMMHYAYHIGQIVYIGTLIKGDTWKSLSIPKGGSRDFNKSKMDQGKHGGHYTDKLK